MPRRITPAPRVRAIVHQQALEHVHLDVFPVEGDRLEHLDALLHLEKRILLGVARHRHHHLVEDHRGARDQVQMAVGHRVKRPRINRDNLLVSRGIHSVGNSKSLPAKFTGCAASAHAYNAWIVSRVVFNPVPVVLLNRFRTARFPNPCEPSTSSARSATRENSPARKSSSSSRARPAVPCLITS